MAVLGIISRKHQAEMLPYEKIFRQKLFEVLQFRLPSAERSVQDIVSNPL